MKAKVMEVKCIIATGDQRGCLLQLTNNRIKVRYYQGGGKCLPNKERK